MKISTRFRLVTLLGTLLSPVVLWAQNPEIRNLTKAWEATLASAAPLNNPQSAIYAGNYYAVACNAAVKASLYEWFPADTPSYATGSITLLNALMTDLPRFLQGYRSATETTPSEAPGTIDFFTAFPMMLAYQKLDVAGQLDATFKTNFKNFAYSYFAKVSSPLKHPDELNNAFFARATGYKKAANLIPDTTPPRDVRLNDWNTLATNVWNKFTGLQDIPEDSAQYIGISHAYLWLMADEMGDLVSPNNSVTRAMVDHLRDQISPAGQMAAYGDSFGANNDDNWPVNLDWAYHVYAFERAGAYFNDGSYRWAANLLANTGYTKEPLNRSYRNIMPLMFLALADGARNTSINAVQPSSGSMLTTRRYQKAPSGTVVNYDEKDKIILSPSRSSGEPFALMDIFPPYGYHTHQNQPGALAYYQQNNVPLLTATDGNMRDPSNSNLFLIKPAGEQFPQRVPSYVLNTWYTTEIPLRNVRWLGSDNTRQFNQLTLRIGLPGAPSGSSVQGTLTVDNLRLSGPSGTILLDAFDATTGWGFPPGTSTAIVTGTQGTGALQVTCTNATIKPAAYFCNKSFGVNTINLSQYNTILIDWRVSDTVDAVRPFVFRVAATTDANGLGSYLTDFLCQSQQLAANQTEAAYASSGGFHLADARYTQWFTYDTTLRRRTVMDARGVLLVRDDVTPGAAANGRHAGPVWNLGATGTPETGGQWVDSSGASRDLFIWQKTDSGRTLGVQTFTQSPARANQRTVYANQTLASASPLRYISLLIPHDPAVTGATVASGVTVNETGSATGATGRTEVTYQLGGQTYRTLLNVLNDDGVSSIVEFGDWQGAPTFVARSQSNTPQYTTNFETNANDLQLDYDAGTQLPLVYDGLKVSNLRLYTQSVLTSTQLLDVLEMRYDAEMPVVGDVSTTAMASVNLYSPNATDIVRVGGNVVTSSYNASAKTVNFTLPVGANQRVAIADPDLLLHWRFDETAGTSAFDRVAARDGSLLNGPAWQLGAGQFNGALSFDGANDIVRHETSVVTGYPFTITAWVKTTGAVQMTVASICNTTNSFVSYEIGLKGTASNRARLIARNTTIIETAGTTAVNNNQWHHLAAVFENSTTRRLYVDGNLEGSDTVNNVAFNTGSNRFSVGAFDRSTPANYYAGSVDDVRVYKRALTQAEINAIR